MWNVSGTKDTADGLTRRETPNLFFEQSGFFIKSVGAVPAATFAAIATIEVVFFGETAVAFGGKIVVDSFDGFFVVVFGQHAFWFWFGF